MVNFKLNYFLYIIKSYMDLHYYTDRKLLFQITILIFLFFNLCQIFFNLVSALLSIESFNYDYEVIPKAIYVGITNFEKIFKHEEFNIF